MPRVSHGIPDGSHWERPMFPAEKSVELVKSDASVQVPLHFFFSQLKRGSGAAGHYPASIYDGLLFTKSKASSVYSNAQQQLLGVGVTNDFARGDDCYDLAADADPAHGTVYMMFNNNTVAVTGANNVFHKYNTATDPYTPIFTANTDISPDFQSGQFASNSITGYTANLSLWIADIHTNEVDLSGYTPGALITVAKGRFKVGVAGEFKVGSVERLFQSGSFVKAKINLHLNVPVVIA